MMNPCVFIMFSVLLLCLETATASQLVAVGGGGDSNGVANKCLNEERHALLHFKSGLQDPFGIGILSTWRAEEDDCCIWEGVTCNSQTDHVTELQLIDFGLGGEIGHSLLNLSYLNHLDLSSNSFHGTIPTFIGSMTRLSYLDLRVNNLNGTIPRSIGSLNELRHLDLSYNSIYGTIPPELGNLTNLQQLNLRSNGRCRVENVDRLSHLAHLEVLSMDEISLAKANHWVDVISSLPNLSYLSLSGCVLSEVMYPYSSFLNSSSSIHTLDLSNNNLTSSMYSWLFPLTSNKLTYLILDSNMLDGIPNYLGNLCSLETLYFDDNSVVKFPEFLNNLSGCASLTLTHLSASGNKLTGSLSDEIQKFSSLQVLGLSHNHLSGTISDKLWKLPRLKSLSVSFNNLRVPSTYHMPNFSLLEYIYMRSCKLGPHFPKWIQTLKNLTYLDISNTGLSDTVPMEFWDTWPSQLRYLNLSSNNFSGKVPDLSSNFDDRSMIDLSSNSFYGPILNVSSTLQSLNLSRNKFTRGISFLCQIVDGFLSFLDLSHNSLTGPLPDCLWHFKELTVLNLGHNNLSGRLPPSVGSLIELQVLYLYNNNFSGELPLSLRNCTSLNSLNLGANKFYGNVPVWIGENLTKLYVLILRANNFRGTIPSELCPLPNLQVLDLSRNYLHGTIPSCLNNLTSMVQESSQKPNVQYFNDYALADYADHAVIEWLGDEREFLKSNMRLLKSIDLSSNNLTGQIPYQLTDLYELLALNLSKNALHGDIPRQISEMKNLLALDLSENNLSGGIPSSMSQMTFLGYLDVSSNRLSGKIPSSTQLQSFSHKSFSPSRYDGNAGLCGPPLTKKCPGDKESEVPLVVGKSEVDEEDKDELWGWFYIGGGTGFVTGFWITCGTLLLNRRGRHVFYKLYDRFRDWVYVKVMVFIAKLQRVSHT